MNPHKILVVDDEKSIVDMVSMTLEMSGYQVITAHNGREALNLAIDHIPELIVSDWMMPEMSGLELTRRLKKTDVTSQIPVILLTAKGDEDSKITGLDAGGDDYIVKPFSPRELVSRIKAILRRSGKSSGTDVYRIDKLEIDLRSGRVNIDGQAIKLGPLEYRLLSFFVNNQDRVYSREQLLDNVWGTNVYVEERTVDVHIRRLRKSISLQGHEELIQTVRGMGYRFSKKS